MMPQEPGPEYDGLRHDIEHTRAELGETVEALAAKVDVKTRAHHMVDEAKTRVRETTRDAATKAGGTARDAATKAGATARDAATKAGSTTRGVASKAGANARGAASQATRVAQAMINRPVVWVLAALAGIGVVSAVAGRRRR